MMPFTPHSLEAPNIPDQACAVPFRRREDGRIEFCVITSTRGRWIFPKGFVDPGDSVVETALKEAFEEAGVHGRIVGKPLGTCRLPKNGDKLVVVARLMEVEKSHATWPEKETRHRRWVSHDEASELLKEPALRQLLNAAARAIDAS